MRKAIKDEHHDKNLSTTTYRKEWQWNLILRQLSILRTVARWPSGDLDTKKISAEFKPLQTERAVTRKSYGVKCDFCEPPIAMKTYCYVEIEQASDLPDKRLLWLIHMPYSEAREGNVVKVLIAS